MGVTSIDTNYDNLTITLIADFDAPIVQVWGLWSDPRKLERWLGSPNHPVPARSTPCSPCDRDDSPFTLAGSAPVVGPLGRHEQAVSREATPKLCIRIG